MFFLQSPAAICKFIFALEMIRIWTYSNAHNDDNRNRLTDALYAKLLKSRHMEQVNAVKSLQRHKNYDHKYKMIVTVAENVFTVIQSSRAYLESSGFIPGVSEFPSDETVRDALSNVLENTILFSEIVLRLPDISASVLKINNNWDVLLQWSLAFTTQMNYLLDKSTMKLLHLVSQELNHVSREADFVNPYRKPQIRAEPNELKKKVKVIKKGPRLHTDL